MNLGKVMIEAVRCSRKSTQGMLGLSLSCATSSPGDLGNSFPWAQVSGKWKGCSDQLWELFSCDSLSSMNLTPKWSVINLSSSCQLRIFSGRNVIRWINRGHLSSGAFLPQVLLPRRVAVLMTPSTDVPGLQMKTQTSTVSSQGRGMAPEPGDKESCLRSQHWLSSWKCHSRSGTSELAQWLPSHCLWSQDQPVTALGCMFLLCLCRGRALERQPEGKESGFPDQWLQ